MGKKLNVKYTASLSILHKTTGNVNFIIKQNNVKKHFVESFVFIYNLKLHLNLKMDSKWKRKGNKIFTSQYSTSLQQYKRIWWTNIDWKLSTQRKKLKNIGTFYYFNEFININAKIFLNKNAASGC